LYFCGVAVRVQIQCSAEVAANITEVERLLRQKAGLSGRVVLVKKSLDARSRVPFFLISGDVFSHDELTPEFERIQLQNVLNAPEVHIIGAGPAGLFAALECIERGFKPVVLERGKAVKERRRDLAIMNRDLVVNAESNYCFGEGGAGTYSDGKLYTRSKKRGSIDRILNTLIYFGADERIRYEAHPHIGTNKLPGIIENIREGIIASGGEVRFDTRVDDFIVQSGKVVELVYAGGIREKVENVILATGHSARDIFEWFGKSGYAIEAKPFALGVRIEHRQEIIDKIQYKCDVRSDFLPPSSYGLVEQVNGRGVFSFCMCPGGIIAPAATSPGEIVVNGWSPSKRNGKFANSGFVVAVEESDFKPFNDRGELRALAFQSFWERKAFEYTGSIVAPAQRVEDFIQNKVSANLPECSYIPGITSSDLRQVLPSSVHERLRGALVQIGKKMPLYRSNEAILVGVESRTSSPVRIPRDPEKLHHPEIENLYPCGEGPGYAGGIMSAALDGVKVVASL
jgi:uncharacterized FAD-dependent dehydrogenase